MMLRGSSQAGGGQRHGKGAGDGEEAGDLEGAGDRLRRDLGATDAERQGKQWEGSRQNCHPLPACAWDLQALAQLLPLPAGPALVLHSGLPSPMALPVALLSFFLLLLLMGLVLWSRARDTGAGLPPAHPPPKAGQPPAAAGGTPPPGSAQGKPRRGSEPRLPLRLPPPPRTGNSGDRGQGHEMAARRRRVF